MEIHNRTLTQQIGFQVREIIILVIKHTDGTIMENTDAHIPAMKPNVNLVII